MIDEYSKEGQFVNQLMSYGFSAQVEIQDIKVYDEILKTVMDNADPKSKVFEQFKNVEDYVEFVKDKLEVNPPAVMLGLYESKVIKPFNDAMTMGGIESTPSIKSQTMNFAKGSIMYSAFGLLGKDVSKKINLESLIQLVDSENK